MTAVPQHMRALELANDVRVANAGFRRMVRAMPPRAGAEYVADVIESDFDHEVYGALPMDRMLMFIRMFGTGKASRCLRTAGVSVGARRLRELTPRQRDAVAAQLRLWGAGYRA